MNSRSGRENQVPAPFPKPRETMTRVSARVQEIL